jgi:capsular exopolysaccharide synthesis family protein
MVSTCFTAVAFAMLSMIAAIVLLSISRKTLKTQSGAKYHMGEAPMGILVYEKIVAPRRKRKIKGLLIWKTAVSFRYTESILQLGYRLFHRMQKENKKVLLITSVAENEGKSTLAANLAFAMSKHGHKVALVDMDLRKPSLHKLYSETDFCVDLGLAMEQGIPEDENRNLFVFTVENPKGNIGAMLHDTRLNDFLQRLRQEMDIVILDSAPYSVVADTGMLLKFADGCLMSVRQDWVPYKVLKGVVRELDECSADYMGYVLNYYLDDGSLRKNDKRYKNYQ